MRIYQATQQMVAEDDEDAPAEDRHVAGKWYFHPGQEDVRVWSVPYDTEDEATRAAIEWESEREESAAEEQQKLDEWDREQKARCDYKTIRYWLDGIKQHLNADQHDRIMRRIVDYVGGDMEEVDQILDDPINEDGYCVVDGFAYAPADTTNGYDVITWELPGDDPQPEDPVNSQCHRGKPTHGDMLAMIREDGDPWFWETQPKAS